MTDNGVAKLSIRDLSRAFHSKKQETVAFENITLDVFDGEFVCIVGPSGCGKTTLLHVLAGLDRESSGTIAIDGEVQPAAKRTAQVGYMFQRDLLLPWKSIVDNVALGLSVGGLPMKEARRRSLELMDQYGLRGFADVYPAQLSGGMRQRAAVIRTLLVDRPIMLFDEPFGALDALTRSVMQAWLLSLWQERKRTTIFITHDIEEAVLLSDRVIVMTPRPGRIAEEVKIDLERPRTEEVVDSPDGIAYKKELLSTLRAMVI